MKIGELRNALDVAGTLAVSCLSAAAIGMVVPPLPLTLLATRRTEREERLLRSHHMLTWADFVVRRLLRIRLTVVGSEHRPRPSRGHLYVCNHQSYVDIPVLMSALETAAFLSMRGVSYLPAIGLCAYAGGTIYVDRKDPRSRRRAMRQTLEMAERSTAMVVFPEGGRSREAGLKPQIQTGLLRAAYKAGLSLVPVALDGCRDVVPTANDRIVRGQSVVVEIGAALSPADYDSGRAFAGAAWQRVGEQFLRCQRARS